MSDIRSKPHTRIDFKKNKEEEEGEEEKDLDFVSS